MKKRKYDTSVFMLHMLGEENLLPYSFRTEIPFSKTFRWQRVDYTSQIRHEYSYLFEDSWHVLVLH